MKCITFLLVLVNIFLSLKLTLAPGKQNSVKPNHWKIAYKYCQHVPNVVFGAHRVCVVPTTVDLVKFQKTKVKMDFGVYIYRWGGGNTTASSYIERSNYW